MKTVLFGGASFVTCDHVATELLEYGVELARRGLAASVDFPIRLDDGTVDTGSVLLGPASQIFVMPDESGDIDCGDAVDVIREAREALTPAWEGALAHSPTSGRDGFGHSLIDPL